MNKPFLIVDVKVTKNGHFCCWVFLDKTVNLIESTSDTSLSLEVDLYAKNRRTVLLLSGAMKARYSYRGRLSIPIL